MDEDPARALEAETAPLIQMAWKLGEFWKACRAAGLPDDVAYHCVTEWHATQLESESPVWRDLGDD